MVRERIVNSKKGQLKSLVASLMTLPFFFWNVGNVFGADKVHPEVKKLAENVMKWGEYTGGYKNNKGVLTKKHDLPIRVGKYKIDINFRDCPPYGYADGRDSIIVHGYIDEGLDANLEIFHERKTKYLERVKVINNLIKSWFNN